MKYRCCIIMMIIFSFINVQVLHSSNYGLFFHAHKVLVNERTSLVLNDRKPFEYNQNFDIQFDLLIRNEPLYGNILNLETPDGHFMNLLINNDEEGNNQISVVFQKQIIPLKTFPELNKWHTFSIKMDLSANNIIIGYNNKSQIVSIPSLNEYKPLSVVFGDYCNGEICPINLRDIKIYCDKKKSYYWKLDKHNKNICYDNINLTKAEAANPHWLLDDHIQWKNIFNKTFNTRTDVVFDENNDAFYFIDSNSIYTYHQETEALTSEPLHGGKKAVNGHGHVFYDRVSHQLVSYSFENQKTTSLSLDNLTWNHKERKSTTSHFYNHSIAFNSADSCYYTFGGYGYHRFSNKLFKIDLHNDSIYELNYTPSLEPRFGSSSCIVDHKLYIFGGFGNESGLQEFSKKTYAELQEIDLKSKTSRCLWKRKNNHTKVLMAATMYYEPIDSSFYAVSMEKGGVLWKIHKNDTVWQQISRPIRNNSIYQDFNFSLYSTAHELYLVLNKISKKEGYNIAIYSINKPFLKEKDILQIMPNEEDSWYATYGIYILLVVILAVIAGYIFYRLYKSKRKRTIISSAIVHTEDGTENNNAPEITYFKRDKACISLLGTFHIIDKAGNDITALFTPRLKSLLILIILYSEKNVEGITINKVLELLWPDKEENSARNNLNVNLRKLRLLIEEVGNMGIVSENGFLHVSWSEDVFCDYHTSLACIAHFKEEEQKNNNELLNKILELMLFGPLLVHTELDWLDSFKGTYSSWSIDLLRELLKLHQDNTQIALKIADIFFKHDPLSEEALAIKCETLIKQGKKGLAMNVYNHFRKDYKELMGEEYTTPINEL